MVNKYSNFKYIDELPIKVKLLRLIWCITWYVLFKTTPRFCLNNWRIFLLKSFGAKIGVGCKVYPSCFVWAPWNLVMGEYSVLADGVDCYSMGMIEIGSKVAVSQRAFLCTGTHDISSLHRPLVIKPITIGDHAWICAESFISPGVHIGNGAIIGARSVVIKNVLDWTIVAGNPAVFRKHRTITENYERS